MFNSPFAGFGGLPSYIGNQRVAYENLVGQARLSYIGNQRVTYENWLGQDRIAYIGNNRVSYTNWLGQDRIGYIGNNRVSYANWLGQDHIEYIGNNRVSYNENWFGVNRVLPARNDFVNYELSRMSHIGGIPVAYNAPFPFGTPLYIGKAPINYSEATPEPSEVWFAPSTTTLESQKALSDIQRLYKSLELPEWLTSAKIPDWVKSEEPNWSNAETPNWANSKKPDWLK